MGSEGGTVYTYIARDRAGRRNEGRIVSDGPDEAIRRLAVIGLYPSRLVETGAERVAPLSPDRLARFMEKLATLLAAGTPLTVALAALSAERDPAAPMAARLDRAVRNGRSLTEAARAENSFDRVTVALLESGEATGALDRALTDAATALDRRQESIRLATDAFRYPALVAGAALGALLILSALVFPKLAATYAAVDLPLPGPTRWLIAMGLFLTGPWGIFVGVGFTGIALFAWRWGRTASGIRRLERWLRSWPLVGDLVARLAVARGGATLSTLLSAGIPIVTALKLSAPATGSPLLADAFDEAARRVAAGKSLTDALAPSGLIPELAVTMISVGEQAGALDTTLMRMADYYESEGRRTIRTAAAYMEPALIALAACVALLLGLGVFLPMWNLTALAHPGGV
ncbi:MAG: type II secretion system F family protein [Nitrospinae bacterium]|nr:type II secretion system F family protein [Nitrospinota bacterium]